MGTFSRRQLPTAKRTGKRQGRFRRRGVNRDGRGAFGGWVLSVVMDKKERGPALSGWPSLVRLCESLPCRCSYTIAHFSVVVNNFLVVAGAFVGCCIRVACGRPLEVRSRPRAGGGWAPAGLVALQVTTLRAACGVAVIRAGRQRSRWWPAGPLRFRRGWAFRCLTTSGGCGVSVAAAATGRSP